RHTRSKRDWSSDVCSSDLLDLGVLECSPIRLLVAEAADIFLHDLLDRHADELGRTRMPCNAHGSLLSIFPLNLFVGTRQSTFHQIGRASCRERVQIWDGAG